MAITRQIIFLAKRDCIEELKALLKSTIEETKKEEGCLIYEVFQTKSNPVEFIVIDSWESEETLNKHWQYHPQIKDNIYISKFGHFHRRKHQISLYSQ